MSDLLKAREIRIVRKTIKILKETTKQGKKRRLRKSRLSDMHKNIEGGGGPGSMIPRKRQKEFGRDPEGNFLKKEGAYHF